MRRKILFWSITILGLSAHAKIATPTPAVATVARYARGTLAMKQKPFQIVLPSNLDPVTDVLTTLTLNNAETVTDLAKIISDMNKVRSTAITFTVFFPESFVGLAPNQKPQVLVQVERIKKELKKQLSSIDFIQFKPHPYLQYSWIQDIGEPVWIRQSEKSNWTQALLDINRGNRPLVTENWPLEAKAILKAELPQEEPLLIGFAIGETFDFSFLRVPASPKNESFEKLENHGGDLEVLPGGTPVIGSQATAEIRTFIEEQTKKSALVVPTGFLQSTQVDQLFAIVPSRQKCGFSLVAASPLAGLLIQKDESFRKSHLTEQMTETLFFFAKSPAVKLETAKLKDFELTREPRKYRQSEIHDEFVDTNRYIDFIVQKSLAAQSEVEKGIALIRERLKAQKVCENVEVIEVPVIAAVPGQTDYFDSVTEGLEESAIHFLTPTPNLVVLDQQLVLANFSNSPSKFRAALQEQTLKAFEAAKIPRQNVHFIRAQSYNEEMGSVHSATLVLRKPDILVPIAVLPSVTPEVPKPTSR